MFADISESPAVSVLQERNVNTSSPSKTRQSEKQDHPNAQHEENTTMQAQNQLESLAQTYVSPSDNIQSPTTRKLSEMKGKRYANVRPQSLFAKTVKKEGLRSQEKINNSSA